MLIDEFIFGHKGKKPQAVGIIGQTRSSAGREKSSDTKFCILAMSAFKVTSHKLNVMKLQNQQQQQLCLCVRGEHRPHAYAAAAYRSFIYTVCCDLANKTTTILKVLLFNNDCACATHTTVKQYTNAHALAT